MEQRGRRRRDERTGGAYTLGGTIGQPDAGAMSVSGYTLAGGFWHDWGAQFDVFLPLVVR